MIMIIHRVWRPHENFPPPRLYFVTPSRAVDTPGARNSWGPLWSVLIMKTHWFPLNKAAFFNPCFWEGDTWPGGGWLISHKQMVEIDIPRHPSHTSWGSVLKHRFTSGGVVQDWMSRGMICPPFQWCGKTQPSQIYPFQLASEVECLF